MDLGVSSMGKHLWGRACRMGLAVRHPAKSEVNGITLFRQTYAAPKVVIHKNTPLYLRLGSPESIRPHDRR